MRRLLRRRYQRQITNETIVAAGGAKPIQSREPESIWLHSHDNGMRNRKVAIRLCIIGNHELPWPLKYELMQNTKLTMTQSIL